ncbi:MAG: zinc ABC transporter substrate-binding protein [Leptospiraceae bacterium]|nr:zinc ABC transporter substrate-binding protein [Leptospiraceae bacterium]MCP5501452.1 zinc ABC transporter substrate-binding protein [Leptospiraceae bacterium]
MFKWIFTFLFLFLSFPAYSKISVVSTTSDLAYIAEQIGGEKVSVFSMIRGSDDPHFVMTRPDYLVKLNKADLFILVGLDLEIGWAPLLIQQSRNLKIQKGQSGYCDASLGIKILGEPAVNVDRSMGDMHIYGNPHYWNDPVNIIRMSNTIEASLSRVDPSNQNYYKKNNKEFKNRIAELTKAEMKKFKPYFGARVAVFHDQFIYLANRFRFTANLSIEEKPGVPPSSRYMEQVIKNMKSNNIKIILIAPYHNIRYANYVSSRVKGSRVLTLPVSVGSLPNTDTYEKALAESLRLIRETLNETGYKK